MFHFEEAIAQAIVGRVFPGASLLVAVGDEILYRGFFGNETLIPSPEPVTEKTLFDIASLTKPIATTALFMLLLSEKELSLNAPAAKYLKPLEHREDKRKITIRHLLKHTSGLPAWRPYFSDIAKDHPKLVGKRECRELYVEKIAQETLEMPVSYQRLYSDLGFILLGILLEEYWETPLDQIFKEKIAKPLQLLNTFYQPIESPSPTPYHFAATEDSSLRKKLIRGEVSDDNAYTLGGVAGHAGLFSHVDDIHQFSVAIKKGLAGSHALFSKDVVEEFIGTKTKIKLGWDIPSLKDSQAGHSFSKNSIGHLGYSGCSFWIDLEQDFHIIFLTNRVHPTNQNEAIKQFRPQLHNSIYEELVRAKISPLKS
ncbi:MAG: serine hydrolase [Deltaproteobacteria bacterium]|nr:serine hydrolase [Deltaproteobacteria bacterium]